MTPSAHKPAPHPSLAATAIAVMALVLAIVLQALGPLASLDRMVGAWFQSLAVGGGMTPIGEAGAWCWSVLMTFGLAQAVLHVRGTWRRLVISVSGLVLTLAWLPILALACRSVDFAAPLVALLWGVVGSLIYAARHQEPV